MRKWIRFCLCLLVAGCNELIDYDELSPTAPGCVSSQQCTDDHGGDPHICIAPGSECQRVLSDECRVIMGDFAAPQAIRVGALVQWSSEPFIDESDAMACALDMAVAEIAHRGIAGPSGVRQLSVVACDEEPDPVGAATHLRSLGMDAIVGPALSNRIAPLSDEVAVPGDMLLIAEGGWLLELVSLADEGLTWSLWPNQSTALDSMVGFLEALEARYRDAHPAVGKIRVAMIVGDTEAEAAAYLVNRDVLHFNGRTALENLADHDASSCPSGCFAVFVDEPPDVLTGMDPVVAPSDVVAFAPHIVVWLADLIDPAIVSALDAETPSEPLHLLMGDSYGAVEYLRGDRDVPPTPGVAQRFFAVGSPAYREVDEAFTTRYAAHCPDSFALAPYVIDSAARAYDGLYLVALAYLAKSNHLIPSQAMTGSLLAAGIGALAPEGQTGAATTVDLGPADLGTAIDVLVGNGFVDVEGASGPLDFDIAVGAPHPSAIDLLCPHPGAQPPASIDWAPSGLAWSWSEAGTSGTIACR